VTTPSRNSLALLHGRLDPSSGRSVSLLVEDGRIALLASAEEVLAKASSGCAIYDLEERLLSPGFVDAHMHFHSLGVRAARPSLSAARSLPEAMEIVRSGAQRARGEVLVAEGWDETKWKSPERPTRRDLDAVLPDRAIIARRVCGHAGAANTAALRWLEEHWGRRGIDFETGTLLEHPILSLDGLLPRTREEEDEAFEAAAAQCFSFGVTTASDFPRPDSLRAYAARTARAPLQLPVHAYLIDPEEHWRDILGGTNRENFRVHGIKLFSDGSIGARTAALFQDYADRAGARGDLLLDAATMANAMHAAHAQDLAVAVHAIGDRAIAEVLAAFAQCPSGESGRCGDRLEHLEMPCCGDAEQLAKLGVRPCMQPNFIAEWGMPGSMYERALGAARVRAMNPLRSVLRAGCGLFFGSDGMPLSPLYGVRAAMTHPLEDERLDAREAQALYTRAGAEVFRQEDLGILREGWVADLAVLPRGVSWENAARDTTMDLTVAAGRVVYASTALSPFVSPGELR
jgi:predicted amidohydrolase YtcJ